MITFEALNDIFRASQHGWVGHGPGILLTFATCNIGERYADIKAGRKPRIAVPDIDLLHADYDVECWWERGRYEMDDLCPYLEAEL